MEETTQSTSTHEETPAQAPEAASPPTPSAEPTPALPDLASLRQAFERHFTALLGAPAVGPATLDVEYGARRALELAALASEPAIAERLALLPTALFAEGRVADLASLAQATLYADSLHKAGAQGGEDKVPEALLEEAEAVRGTLHKLLDYHFGDDATVSAELAEFRARRGAFRVAATLARLATLSRERVDHLAKDTKYWRDGLITDAERLATQIQGSVTALSEKDALELKRRAYGLLEALFGDVRQALAFVMRHDTKLVDALPVLKKPQQRKPKGDGAA